MRIKLSSVLLVCALVLGGCKSGTGASAKSAPPPLTEAERKLNLESFDMVWTTIRDKHFDPKLNGVPWDDVRAELRPKVEVATTTDEARGAMEDMISRLGQTHFGIIPSTVYTDMDVKKVAGAEADDETKIPVDADPRAGDSGIHLSVVDGAALVTRVEAGSAGAEAGVKPGWELVSIKGKPIKPIIEAAAKAFEGKTLLEGMQSIMVQSVLSGRVGKKFNAGFNTGPKGKRDVELTLKQNAGRASKFGNVPTMYVKVDSRRLPENVQYFALNTFFDAQHVMTEFQKAVESASDADGFVIDLRGNPGGFGAMAMGMGNWFVDQPNLFLGSMQTRSGALKFILSPQAVTFSKPVAVLIDGGSMSTSEILAAGLQDIGRAKLFGTRTGGAALPSVIVKLPNGDGFQYAMANYISSGGKVLEGNGVQPDVMVKPNQKSLLAGTDPILDAAVKWIRSQKTQTLKQPA